MPPWSVFAPGGNSPQAVATQRRERAQRADDERREGEDCGRRAENPGHAVGLVSSDILGRASSVEFSVADLYPRNFPSADLVSAAAGLFEDGRLRLSSSQLREGTPARASVARFIVGPGVVQIGRRQLFAGERSEDEPLRWPTRDHFPRGVAELIEFLEMDDPAEQAFARSGLGEDLPDVLATLRAEKIGTKTEVTEWSRKSRAQMVRRLASLDYAPMFADSATLPAMVTLTLPGRWEHLAPDGVTFKSHLKAWRKRFERDWGELVVNPETGRKRRIKAQIRAVWKLEFQRRGAPHAHLLMAVPTGLNDRGETFTAWCSRSWAEVVGAEGEEFRRHLLAGTGVDIAEGLRARDPKRAAVYFLKHQTGSGSGASKEYQHVVPALWQEPGKGPGRFWGVWGLEPVEASVVLDDQDAVEVGRIMRRWSRANAGVRRVRRPRHRINPETGEVLTSYRWQTVRGGNCNGNRGWLAVNDGPAFASQLARALALIREA